MWTHWACPVDGESVLDRVGRDRQASHVLHHSNHNLLTEMDIDSTGASNGTRTRFPIHTVHALLSMAWYGFECINFSILVSSIRPLWIRNIRVDTDVRNPCERLESMRREVSKINTVGEFANSNLYAAAGVRGIGLRRKRRKHTIPLRSMV